MAMLNNHRVSYRYLCIPSPQHDDARAQALVMGCANVSTLLPPGPNPSADDVPPTRFFGVSSLGRIWFLKKWNMIGVLIFYLLQGEYVCICVFCFVVWSDLLELSIVSRGAVFMCCFLWRKFLMLSQNVSTINYSSSCHPLLIFPSGINCKSHTSNKQGVSMTGMSQWVNLLSVPSGCCP